MTTKQLSSRAFLKPVVLLVIVAALLAQGQAAHAATITEYPIPTPASGPAGITTGPDAALWFTEAGGNKIVRLTTSGSFSEFPTPTQPSQPDGIAAGPDGALWFTEEIGNKIGRITIGGSFSEFPVPTAFNDAAGITAGSDGALWFNECCSANKIGRITTSGSFTEFPIPTPASASAFITAGPDGALWFTETIGNKIGRLTTSGSFTEFPIPTPTSDPSGITAGADGALWFTESSNPANKIGRITTSGSFTEFPIPTPGSAPIGITAGPDGALWFTEDNTDKIGRITIGGSFSEFPIPTPASSPVRITAGPDGALWFTEDIGNKIGRITAVDPPITASGTTFRATEGTSFSGTVATFTDPDSSATATEYSATINWGDSSSSPGTISGPTGGPFTVRGTHTYAEEGTYPVKVTITDVDTPPNSATAKSTANVADAALSSSCAMPPFTQQSYSGPTATFSDQSSTGTLNDFSATINWGDSSSSPGTITGGPGNAPYTVSGSHTYASTGPFTVTTTVRDVGGSTTTATCSVLVFAFATSSGGSFVIGDLEATLANHVTWWGSMWAQLNPMSGGPAPASMKGFAGFEDNPDGLPPACGGTWTTDPGNSTPPPPSAPTFMGVLVSSKITKSGSVISGDIKEIVVVKTDPGYAPSPGHEGTGTVIAIVCIH